ncbi:MULTISPECIES: hypothetical protein [Cellulomonas]|uniref:WXG100 family type VII secretion target n=2 Tax=Cellulomonas iranensis TaxID=76862 RepID=A0ABU0GFM1_9CELL|nr:MULTISPECIES: hypothetical protein [Cellulomonas]MDQ0424157.1 hypothetical protein [Cellulomonas iranensis]TFH72939.1 hypothetical protein E4A51_05885 [Cellulomonas sp. HD19AZ1]
MTDAFHGADVAALRTQAVALHDAAQTLVTCAQRTGRGLDALTWAGRDADRARTAWQTEQVPALLRTAHALGEAALRLLDEADAQESASAATGVPGGATEGPGGAAPTPGSGPGAAVPAPAPAGTGTATGAGTSWADVRAQVDRAHDVVSDALGRLGTVTTAADAAAVAAALGRWDNVTLGSSYRVLDQAVGIMQDAHIGPAVGGVLQGAAALGVASDAYGAYRAHGAGDLHGTVDNAVSAVLGAGSFVPGWGLGSAALGASWQVGTAVGTAANDAMQGTDFHARFTDRMDAAFDLGGAWGMLNTPGALIVTGAEEVGLRARALWDGLTGPADGTLDGRR